MKILEKDLQNMKKRRSGNVAEMTDYDHFRAKIAYRNSISRLNTTKFLESVIPSIFQTISCKKSTHFKPSKIEFQNLMENRHISKQKIELI
jgi:arginyl-tRNA--protein-N-Asp/Glu arginylyltransferase